MRASAMFSRPAKIFWRSQPWVTREGSREGQKGVAPRHKVPARVYNVHFSCWGSPEEPCEVYVDIHCAEEEL